MIKLGEQIRLTPKDKKILGGLTGSDPSHIKTQKQLKNFITAHQVNYPGRSPEEKLLRKMLDSYLP